MSDLTTLAAVKARLRIAGMSDDWLFGMLITQASQFIQAWLNRSLAVASYTETRDGTGSRTMMFANYPVTSVSSQIGRAHV